MPSQKRRSMKILHEEADAASVRVTEGKYVSDYKVERIPSDFGKAFEVTKVAGKILPNSSRTHHVVLEAGELASCSCPGWTYHGRCKHAAMCRVLLNRGVVI